VADRKHITLVYNWTSPADQAESDLGAVLAGHLSPYDFAGLTVDSYVEDLTDQEVADQLVWEFGENPEDAA
jgi:hypothetical protein